MLTFVVAFFVFLQNFYSFNIDIWMAGLQVNMAQNLCTSEKSVWQLRTFVVKPTKGKHTTSPSPRILHHLATLVQLKEAHEFPYRALQTLPPPSLFQKQQQSCIANFSLPQLVRNSWSKLSSQTIYFIWSQSLFRSITQAHVVGQSNTYSTRNCAVTLLSWVNSPHWPQYTIVWEVTSWWSKRDWKQLINNVQYGWRTQETQLF